ncbi:MAG TPA: tetratricopeptide repeat protein, partial [Kofleriaceae bacterium]|nr:tetratricopeptide repeat protein [Kofleriaceae bacterium]
MGLVLVCTTPRVMASPAAGKAANARGMSLMGQKKWAAAEVEFKQAVAEDPASVKAHYNLASAASRAHDLETAIWEIAWVGDRGAWDDEANAAAKKAPKDEDLSWALEKSG